jgi:hypothetical protein
MMGVLRPWQGGEFADRKVTRVQLSTSVVRVGPTVWRAETVRVTWASLQLKGAVMHRLFKRAANTPPTLLNGSDGRSGITSAIVAINCSEANGVLQFVGDKKATTHLSVLGCTRSMGASRARRSARLSLVEIGGLSASEAQSYDELVYAVNPQRSSARGVLA